VLTRWLSSLILKFYIFATTVPLVYHYYHATWPPMTVNFYCFILLTFPLHYSNILKRLQWRSGNYYNLFDVFKYNSVYKFGIHMKNMLGMLIIHIVWMPTVTWQSMCSFVFIYYIYLKIVFVCILKLFIYFLGTQKWMLTCSKVWN